jgi:hypothetical protein
MWQRIQTIFLVLIVVAMVISIFMPFWLYTDPGTGDRHQLFPMHYLITGSTESSVVFPYCITSFLMAAAATIAVMTIRRFDNRATQMKLCVLNSLVLLCVMIAAVAFTYKLSGQVQGRWSYGPGLWTIFAGVAFNWLALRFIRRDEKLVRDSERLR